MYDALLNSSFKPSLMHATEILLSDWHDTNTKFKRSMQRGGDGHIILLVAYPRR